MKKIILLFLLFSFSVSACLPKDPAGKNNWYWSFKIEGNNLEYMDWEWNCFYEPVAEKFYVECFKETGEADFFYALDVKYLENK